MDRRIIVYAAGGGLLLFAGLAFLLPRTNDPSPVRYSVKPGMSMVEAQKVLKGYVSVTWDPYSLKKVDLSHPKYYDGSNGNFYVLDVPEKGKYLTIRHTGASASLTENFPSKNFPSSYKYLKNGTQIGVTKLFAILKKFDVRSIEAENYGRDVELPNEYIDWSHFSGTVMKNDYGASHSFLHTFTFKDGKFVKVKLEIDASPMGYYK